MSNNRSERFTIRLRADDRRALNDIKRGLRETTTIQPASITDTYAVRHALHLVHEAINREVREHGKARRGNR